MPELNGASVASKLDQIYELAMLGVIGVEEIAELIGAEIPAGEDLERAKRRLEEAIAERDRLLQEQTA